MYLDQSSYINIGNISFVQKSKIPNHSELLLNHIFILFTHY